MEGENKETDVIPTQCIKPDSLVDNGLETIRRVLWFKLLM